MFLPKHATKKTYYTLSYEEKTKSVIFKGLFIIVCMKKKKHIEGEKSVVDVKGTTRNAKQKKSENGVGGLV